MKRTTILVLLVLGVVLVTHVPELAFASPGGKIASAAFKSFWGKAFLAVLTLIFFPLFLFIFISEHMAARRTLADLKRLAATNPQFDWFTLKDRATDVFHRVHAAWRKEDMSEASDWMTSWYWQNQQLAFLNQWEEAGLVNHCTVKKLSNIRPLFLAVRNPDDGFEGTRFVVAISAVLEDFLARRDDGTIVEGKKGFDTDENVWSFVYEKGRWVLAGIEDGAQSLTYARMRNELVPAVVATDPATVRAPI